MATKAKKYNFTRSSDFCLKNPVKITHNLDLVNDKGYLYFTYPGSFYDVNFNVGISIPDKRIVNSKKLEIQWIDDVDPVNSKIIGEYNKLYNLKLNPETGKHQYCKEVEIITQEVEEVEEPRDILNWHYDKPNINLLLDICKMAAQIYNEFKSEMEAFIIYNYEKDDYELMIPPQEVSGASCSFNYDNVIPGTHVVVVDVHSHHTMGISHSSVDDDDDSATSYIPHLSVVIKDIKNFDFTNYGKNLDIRLTVNNKFEILDLEDVFQIDTYDLPQIKKKETLVLTGNKYGAAAESKYNYGKDYYGDSYDYYSGWGMPKIPYTRQASNNDDWYSKNKNSIPNLGGKAESDPIIATKNIVDIITVDGKPYDISTIMANMDETEYKRILEDIDGTDFVDYSVKFNCDLKEFIRNYFKNNPELVKEYCSKLFGVSTLEL